MQLLHAGMGMRRVARTGCETHQHADTVSLNVCREQLAFDPWCVLLPFRLEPLPWRRRHGLPAGLLGEIGRASCRERVEISVVAVSLKKKRVDHRTRRLEYTTACRARGDVGVDRGNRGSM